MLEQDKIDEYSKLLKECEQAKQSSKQVRLCKRHGLLCVGKEIALRFGRRSVLLRHRLQSGGLFLFQLGIFA